MPMVAEAWTVVVDEVGLLVDPTAIVHVHGRNAISEERVLGPWTRFGVDRPPAVPLRSHPRHSSPAGPALEELGELGDSLGRNHSHVVRP